MSEYGPNDRCTECDAHISEPHDPSCSHAGDGDGITITHTHQDGTLIEGSRKGDGVYDILRGLRDNWRYFPSLRQIGLGQSRDKAAKTWVIDRAAKALREAGHEVTVEIDESQRRSFAEAEAERYERADNRAEYHANAAGSAAAKSEAAWTAEHGILDMIPMGQPILSGHHSERGHRRALERAESLRRRGMAEADRAEYHEDRAEAAERFQAKRESIPTTLRRIAKLEAEQRGIKRRLAGRMDWVPDGNGGHKLALVKPGDGYRARLEVHAADLAEQLAYWREHIAKQEAEGVKVWSREDFTKGDYVQFIGTWYEVVRVNAKSLTIPAMINDGVIVHKDGNRCTWTDTVAYSKVTGRKSATEIAEILAAAEAKAAS